MLYLEITKYVSISISKLGQLFYFAYKYIKHFYMISFHPTIL